MRKTDLFASLKVVLTVIILILLVRNFAFTSCTIPSSGMENTLYQGERMWVNLWSYGLRLPFSTSRWAYQKPLRGEVVLFNNPHPSYSQTPIYQRELFVGRCVGTPGDTLMLDDELLVTNERVLNPDSKTLYAYSYADEEKVEKAIKQLNLTKNPLVGYTEGKHIRSLSHYEYYLLNQRLSTQVKFESVSGKEEKNHPLVIPGKGMTLQIYPWNQTLLCNTLVLHEKKQAYIQNDTLYVEGKPTFSYTFTQDYYWMVANNPINLCDSRLFGLVPHSHLKGRATRIWFSKQKERILQAIQ